MMKKYYHWFVCFACALVTFCSIGLVLNALTIYLPYIEASGISGTAGSTMLMIKSLFSFFSIFLVNQFYRVFSLRKGIAAALFTGAAGSFLCAHGAGLIEYYAGAACFGLTYGLGAMIPVSLVINNWFDSRRGTAVAVASLGSGVASIIFPPIVTAAVEKYGLGIPMLLQGILISLIAVISFLIIRDTPEELGLTAFREEKPAGEGERASEKTVPQKEKTHQTPDTADRNGLDRNDWLYLAPFFFLIGGTAQAALGHIGVLFTTEGYSSKVFAAVFSIAAIVLCIGKLLYGLMSDRFGTYSATLFDFTCAAIGCFLAVYLKKSLVFCILFGAFFGLGFPPCPFGVPLWASDLESKEHFQDTVWKMQIIYALGGVLINLLPGVIYDHTGEYVSSYVMFASAMAVSMLLLTAVYRRHGFFVRRKEQ